MFVKLKHDLYYVDDDASLNVHCLLTKEGLENFVYKYASEGEVFKYEPDGDYYYNYNSETRIEKEHIEEIDMSFDFIPESNTRAFNALIRDLFKRLKPNSFTHYYNDKASTTRRKCFKMYSKDTFVCNCVLELLKEKGYEGWELYDSSNATPYPCVGIKKVIKL